MTMAGLKVWFICVAIFAVHFQAHGSYPVTYGPEISLHNIDKVWVKGITGKNVVVAVIDDGLNYKHRDLKPNYNETVSYDFVNNDASPMSNFRMDHGTQCAGVIAARSERPTCRTGVAYEAQLAGLRFFDSSTSLNKTQNAAGFGYKRNEIDIYSNSWGPKDNGFSIEGPGIQERNAFQEGAKQGRKGLGSIFVFASGNGGIFGDSCAFNGYVNNIHTIAIGAFSKDGVPRYAEYCSSVIAAAYGDNVKTSGGINNNECVHDFGRTSAATAMASGIIALLLQANNKLTWRDVQHLIVRTSNPRGVNIDRREWSVNGAGLMVHPAVGFGIMDAKKIVEVAQNQWISVPQQSSCSIEFKETSSRSSFSKEKKNAECSKIKAIEHVHVNLSLKFQHRAIMEMYLISPQGTRSKLLYKRTFDSFTSRKRYKNLIITSLHFWGENADGNWKVEFKTAESMRFLGKSNGKGWYKLKITFHGTESDPLSANQLPKDTVKCGTNKIWKGYGSGCCGSWAYNRNNEHCCRKTNEIVEKDPKCGNEEYNNCRQICCGGVVRNKFQNGAQMSCCNQILYDINKKNCCGDKLYSTALTCMWSWRKSGRFFHKTECLKSGRTRKVVSQTPCSRTWRYNKNYNDKEKDKHYEVHVSSVQRSYGEDITVVANQGSQPKIATNPTQPMNGISTAKSTSIGCRDKQECVYFVHCMSSFWDRKYREENCAKTCGVC